MTTPQELFESLQPLMAEAFSGDGERWLEEANKRLLGHEAADGEEAAGLHKYGVNHLRQGKDFLAEPVAELLDAIVQAGPLCEQRLALGIETWPSLKRRFVRIAIDHMFKALNALEAARGEKG